MFSSARAALILWACMPAHVWTAKLSLRGADSSIVMNGAMLQAQCAGNEARVAYLKDAEAVETQNITLYLVDVPASCYGLDLSVPCASAGEQLHRPKTLHCKFSTPTGASISTGAFAAEATYKMVNDAAVGVQVYLNCIVPRRIELAALDGAESRQDGRLLVTVSVELHHKDVTVLPFVGLADGDVIAVQESKPAAPPTTPPAPPLLPPPPSPPPPLPPAPTLTCPRAPGYHYLFELEDDRSVDDMPDDVSAIAAGKRTPRSSCLLSTSHHPQQSPISSV